MIEIKCSKAQFNRIIHRLMIGCLIDDKCVLGKNEFTCHFIKGKTPSCTECLKQHIKRID